MCSPSVLGLSEGLTTPHSKIQLLTTGPRNCRALLRGNEPLGSINGG
jgi:hypothetical protein